MSSILNWFRKTNVSTRITNVQKDNSEIHQLPLIEYDFSQDEIGLTVKKLWDDSECSNITPNKDIMRKRMIFLIKFYETYEFFLSEKDIQSKLIQSFHNESSLSNNESKFSITPDIIHTIGHPTLVIMYITSSFIHETGYFCSADQQSSNNTKLSQKLYFLLLIKCVDLLCCWPHNCAIINYKIGKEVIESITSTVYIAMEFFIQSNERNSDSNLDMDNKIMFETLIRMLSLLARLQEYDISNRIVNIEDINKLNEVVAINSSMPLDDKILESYGFLLVNTMPECNYDYRDRELCVKTSKKTNKGITNNESSISSKLLSVDFSSLLVSLLIKINREIDTILDSVNPLENEWMKSLFLLRIQLLHTMLCSLHTGECIMYSNQLKTGISHIISNAYYKVSKAWMDNEQINRLLVVQFLFYLKIINQMNVCRVSVDPRLLVDCMGAYIQWGRVLCDCQTVDLKNLSVKDMKINISLLTSSELQFNLTRSIEDHFKVYKNFTDQCKFTLCNKKVTSEDLKKLFGSSIEIWTSLLDYIFLQSTMNNSNMTLKALTNLIKADILKYQNNLTFPIFQIYFVYYIRMFLKSNSVQCIQEIRLIDLSSILLGNYFLTGGEMELRYQSFTIETKKDNGDNYIEIISGDISSNNELTAYLWSFLHDSVITLFDKVVETWYYEDLSPLLSCTERAVEVVQLLQFLVEKVNKFENKTQEYSRLMFQLHLGLLAIVQNIYDKKDADYSLSEILVYCIEVASHFTIMLGVKDVKPSKISQDNESCFSNDLFILPAYCSNASLTMKIFEAQENKKIPWYYLLVDSNYYNPSENLINWRNPISDISINFPKKVTAGRVRMQLILHLLFYPCSRIYSLMIINEIFEQFILDTSITSKVTDSLDPNSIKKVAFETLISELLYGLLEISSFAPKYPAWCKSYETAIYVLMALNYFISDLDPEKLQKKQNIVRQSDSISHLIFSLVRCLKVPVDEDKELVSEILRNGIDLLTNIMIGNELCKTDFRSILSANGRIENIFLPGSIGVIQKLTKNVLNDPNVSYITFTNIVLETVSPPTYEIVLSIFLMILDKSRSCEYSIVNSNRLFGDDEDRPKILNPGAIPLLFLILPHCSVNIQKTFFTSFYNLISGRAALINLNVCTTQAKVIDYVIDLFPYAESEIQCILLNILKMLGRHRIFVYQLKHLFSTLRSKNDCRPVFTTSVLEALQGMITSSYAPRYTFVFEGINSGLRIPAISRWPANKAFSFCTWIKVEIPKRNKSTRGKLLEYQPYILSIRTEQGLGIDFYLIASGAGEFRLALRGSEAGENSIIQSDLEDMVVREGVWHFVSFSIFFPTILHKGWASIALDNKYVNYFASFPKLVENVLSSLIGTSNDSEQKIASMINPTFQGQLGALNFFSDVLTEQQILGIYELGPDYYFCFDSNSVTTTNEKSHNSSILFDGTLKSLVMLSFNPMIWSQDLFLDATPDSNSQNLKWRPKNVITVSGQQYKMNAERLPGTFQSVTDDILISLDALGGVKIFFPIIDQLNKPMYDIRTQQTVNTFDINILKTVLELIFVVTERRHENDRILRKVNGFSFIIDICYNIFHYLDMETLEAMIKIYARSIRSSFFQDSWLPLNFLEFVLCNFKLWMFAPVDVHRRLFKWLNQELEFLCKSPTATHINKIREILSPQKLMNIMYLLYDYSKPDTRNEDISFSVYFTSTLINPFTNEIVGQRLSQNNIGELRPLIFNLVKSFLTHYHSLLAEDISSIVIYSALTDSVQSKYETLLFLLDFITSDARKSRISNQIIQGLVNKQSLRILLSYHSDENRQVRLTSMLLFCKILTLIPLFEGCGERNLKEEEVFRIHENSDVFALLQALGVENNIQFHRMLSYIEDKMVDHLLKEDEFRETHIKVTLVAFQSLFLGDKDNVFLKLSNEMMWSSSSPSYAYTIEGPQMCFPTMFKTILSFVNNDFIGPDGRLSLIVSLKLAVCNYYQVADRILSIDNWFKNLFKIIRSETIRLKELSASSKFSGLVSELRVIEKYECVIDTTVRFIGELLYIAFIIGKPIDSIKAVFSQIEIQSIEEYQDAVLAKKRNPGGVVLLDMMKYLNNVSYDETKTNSYDFDVEFKIYTILLLLLQQYIQPFIKKNQELERLKNKEIPFVSSFERQEKLFFFNLWIIAISLLEFFQRLNKLPAFQRNLFWELINQLFNLLDTLEVLVPSWRLYGATDMQRKSGKTVFRTFSKSDDSHELKYCGGLTWLLIQILTIASKISINLNSDESTKCTTLHIMNKLDIILDDSLVDCHNEKLWVLCHLHNFLLIGTKDQQWVKGAITFFSRLFVLEIDVIVLRVSNPNFQNEGLVNDNLNTISPLNLKEKWLELAFYINHCLKEDCIEESIFRAIVKTMGSRLPTNVRLSPNLWNSFKVANIEYVIKCFHVEQVGKQLSLMELEEYGAGLNQQDRSSIMSDRNVYDFHYDWDQLETKCLSIRCLHLDRIVEFIKTIEMQKIRNQAKFPSVFASVTNERGPWGVGVGSDIQLYWKMDSVETNNRTRLRLTRHPFGCRHERASQATKGSAIDTSVTDMTDDKSLKSLMKYKKDDKATIKIENELLKDDNEEEADTRLSDTEPVSITTDSDSILFTASAEVITCCSTTYGGRTSGVVEISKSRFSFSKSNELEAKTSNPDIHWLHKSYPSTVWSTSELCAMYQRRYLHQWTAIELFFTNRTNILLNLYNEKQAAQCYRIIRDSVKPPQLFVPAHRIRPALSMEKLGRQGTNISLTQAWINREISNFEYIMHMNTIAGRSFNDLGQYPVFPWILSDYVSSKLDLRDPEVYRDLKMPIGAQTSVQREKCVKMYENSLDLFKQSQDEFPPFHHGSHFSTPAFVFGYLIRLEPFTSLHINLQDGKFDKPDRLFHSISSTWKGCTSNCSDVKELIPEFFTCPEFLENIQGIDLGIMQNQSSIGSVELPPWCSNAHEFIQIHRAALESDYVSLNLHHWIDLVFGYKQNPSTQDAIDNYNVFFHLTYPDAVNLHQLKEQDPVLYLRTIRQIDGYGQMPSQLFKKPHPVRKKFSEMNIIWPIASQIVGIDTLPADVPYPERPNSVVCYTEVKISNSPIRSCPILFLYVISSLERLITIDSARVYGNHRFATKHPDVVPPFTFKCAFSAETATTSIGAPFASPGIFLEFLELKPSLSFTWIGTPDNKKRMLREESKRMQTEVINSNLNSESSKKVLITPDSEQQVLESPYNGERNQRNNSLARTSINDESISSSRLNKSDQERIDDHLSSTLFAILPNLKLLFSCGHWDNSFKVSSVETGNLIQSVLYHYEVVTCVTTISDYSLNWVITGSKDCTVIIWEIVNDRDNPVNPNPLHILHGHDDAVISIAGNAELDTLVSGSRDGTIMLHSLRTGLYIRSISQSSLNIHKNLSDPIKSNQDEGHLIVIHRKMVNLLCISKLGYIITYSVDGNLLSTYSINGRFIKKVDTGEKLNVMILSEDNTVLLTGGERCLVVLRWVLSLTLANTGPRHGLEAIIDGDNDDKGPFRSPIRSLHLTPSERHLIVGLESGHIRILAHDAEYLKLRLQSKLYFLGML